MSGTRKVNGTIVIDNDISYIDDSSHHKHKLDIIAPTNANKLPVVFFVHGGGWKRGDRKWRGHLYQNVGLALAKHNFVTVCISYRLSAFGRLGKILLFLLVSALIGGLCFAAYKLLNYFGIFSIPDDYVQLASACALFLVTGSVYSIQNIYIHEGEEHIKHPDHINDVASAYLWVTKNIHKYGGDPNNIIVMGHSAGGHLATLLALDNSFIKKVGGDLSGLKGVVGVSGVYNFGRLRKINFIGDMFYVRPALGGNNKTLMVNASSLTYASKTPFPFLLLNAKRDMHLQRDAAELENALKEHDVEVDRHVVDGTNHMTIISYMNKNYDKTTPIIVDWINKVLSKQ
eukprot:TRINITY_DN5857_c0_g1_i1.p2 TRINITY_DN5857_c0_g1~~TRINITY_DN5857_c0_g1_i1.p2  ORF type:complete len:344 (-),score=35.44 TRINITY_DN5857_c0_g1_i1:1180-2211(-)